MKITNEELFWVTEELRKFTVPQMKPTQTLKLADEFFPEVFRGDKSITIRKGRRDIQLGPLVLEATDGSFPSMTVRVWKVLWKPFVDLTNEEIEADGGKDHESFLLEMQRFYPDMDWRDIVTVIEWE